MTAAKRGKPPADALYHRTKVPPPQGLSLPEALELLTVKPGEIKDTLDKLVMQARWLAARHPDTPIAGEAGDLVTEISFAIGMSGEARDLQFIRVGRAIERLAVQTSDVARVMTARRRSVAPLKDSHHVSTRDPELTRRIVEIAKRKRPFFRPDELVGIVSSTLGRGIRGASKDAIRATLRAEGVLPPAKPRHKKRKR